MTKKKTKRRAVRNPITGRVEYYTNTKTEAIRDPFTGRVIGRRKKREKSNDLLGGWSDLTFNQGYKPKRRATKRRRKQDESIDLDELVEFISELPPFIQVIALGFIIWIGGTIINTFSPQYTILFYALTISLLILYYGYNIYKRKDNTSELIKYLFTSNKKPKEKKKGRLVPKLTAEQKEHILSLFGHRCAVPNCYETEALEIHHIIPVTEEGTSNNINNLIALCPTHHAKVNIWGRNKLRIWAKKARKKMRQYQ